MNWTLAEDIGLWIVLIALVAFLLWFARIMWQGVAAATTASKTKKPNDNEVANAKRDG